MQNNKKSSTSRSRQVPSVEETTAAITAEQDLEEAANSLPQSDKSATFENQKQSSSSVNLERSHDSSNEQSEDHGKQAAHSGQDILLVPLNCQETDDRAQKILDNLQRGRESRIQHHSLILDDLKELRMHGELSEDQNYVTTPFEDLHRLVTTMKMANVILNERVHESRKAKLNELLVEIDAGHCPNMQALLVERENEV
jgi:hypothetical protein